MGSLIINSIIKRCLLSTAMSCFLAANGAGKHVQPLPCMVLRARHWVRGELWGHAVPGSARCLRCSGRALEMASDTFCWVSRGKEALRQ